MQTIELTLYKFSELSPESQTAAIEHRRRSELDYEWWDCTYEDFQAICKILGLYDVKPQFSGFCSQGDGASFSGRFEYGKQCTKLIREYAPTDKTLHAIADTLAQLQRPHFYQLCGVVEANGRYCHEYTMQLDSVESRTTGNTVERPNELAADFLEAFRDLARWLYRQLEQESEYLASEEHLREVLMGNDDDCYLASGSTY